MRVIAAMSGGVDSSVVAGLLKSLGHDVIGVTLQLYDHGAATARSGSCCAGQDIHDARRVASQLGIPHYVLDYEQRFRTAVMETFAASYAAGETPLAIGSELILGVRVRSTQPIRPARLHLGPQGLAHVVLDQPEFGIATGQACVFYADLSAGTRVLGGGLVALVLRADEIGQDEAAQHGATRVGGMLAPNPIAGF